MTGIEGIVAMLIKLAMLIIQILHIVVTKILPVFR